MGDGDDGRRDVERLHKISKVRHSLGQRSPLSESIGIAHSELIDRNDPNVVGGKGEQSAPEVRPGRVAVNTHNGEAGLINSFSERVKVVKCVVGIT